MLKRKPVATDGTMARFLREASSAEKKKVFLKVMRDANEMQRQVIAASEALKQA